MKRYILMLAILVLNSSCSDFNILSGVSAGEENTESAILYSARMNLASGDWDAALSDFARLSADTLAEPDVLVDHASAYSGRCGLDFITLAENINNLGTTHITQMLLQSFIAASAANWVDCKASETLLKSIMDPSTKIVSTERGQFLMAFNSFAKIGALLNYRADVDKDGSADAAWNPCGASGATDLPEAEVHEILTAIVLFYRNLQSTSYGSSLVTAIDTICTAVDGTSADFCSITDTTDTNLSDPTNGPAMRALVRAILVETTDGVGLNIEPGGVLANASAPACIY